MRVVAHNGSDRRGNAGRSAPTGAAPPLLVLLLAPILSALLVGCAGGPVLTAEMPLHLEDRLADATVHGSVVPPEDLEKISWTFDADDSPWRPAVASGPLMPTPIMNRAGDALRVTVSARNVHPNGSTRALLYAPVPNLDRAQWESVVIRARAEGSVRFLYPSYNVRALAPRLDPLLRKVDSVGRSRPGWANAVFLSANNGVNLVRDGALHTYRLPIPLKNPVATDPVWEGPIREIGVGTGTNVGDKPDGSVEILSIALERRGASFAGSPAGSRDIDRDGVRRPSLFTHAPSRLAWRVRIPKNGRFSFAITTHDTRDSVAFSVELSVGGRDTSVFREVMVDDTKWHERSVDLSAYAGRTVDLVLRTESAREGQIGFWGTPILGRTTRDAAAAKRAPNVILYVIDGGGADFMSLYGYNRATTPNLEGLAAEAVVFERAHSNSSWTKPSTTSFMTSLQHSALGGYRRWGDLIPESAPTMAQLFHSAGYQTAVLTFNPNAGRSSALNRGVDRFRDVPQEGQEQNESSRHLEREFWEWREAFPAQPYWVHFQTIDVHEPLVPVPPFAGLFVTAARRERFIGRPATGNSVAVEGWLRKVRSAPVWNGRAARGEISLAANYREAFAMLGIDRIDFYDTQRGLYDETMVHADHQLGRFVERLKASGEWENTILIVTSDHGHPAGDHTRFGRELFDPLPAETEGAFLDSYRTRVPLMIFAPGRLPTGVRISEPVSLVDLLPTVLELSGLPPLVRSQGRSLVPLMRGDPNWETRPVILEQMERDVRTDEWTGHIEMIDGRWGASLEIWPQRKAGDPPVQPSRWEAKARFHVDGEPPLLLYDLWDDPFVRKNVNARYPELVEKYTRLLEAQWQAHLAMAALSGPGGNVELSPAQLERLRALGYIR